MNDHEIDQLLTLSCLVSDDWVATVDLDDAEIDLMEEIMATTPSPAARRVGLRVTLALGAVAAMVLTVVLVRNPSGPDLESRSQSPTSGPTITLTPPPPLGDFRPLISDNPPAGLGLTGAGVLPGDEGESPTQTIRFYGDIGGEQAGDEVLLWLSPIGMHAMSDPDVGRPVAVRGKPGYACETYSDGLCPPYPGATGLAWEESAGHHVGLLSRTLTTDQLLAVADGLVEQDGQLVLGAAPPGVGPLAEVGVAEYPTGGAKQYFLEFTSANDANRLSIGRFFPRDPTQPLLTRWLAYGEASVQVRGHEAWIYDTAHGLSVDWEEAPGELVTVTTTNLNRNDLLAFVEDLRPATDEEWQAILDEVAG